MIDFSVSIELAFAENDRPLPDRVRAAADAGFGAVEIWHHAGKPLAALEQALGETGVHLHTLCVEDWRDKCQLGDPRSHAAFLDRVKLAADAARTLGCTKLVVLAGDVVEGPLEVQRAALCDVLQRAGDLVASEDMELLLEVVNRQFEGPNALVADSPTAIAVLEAVDRPNVRFLYDRYHAILNGEPLGAATAGKLHLVGHVQAADIPGRHEFGTGEIDWAAEINWLSSAGYDGLIGIEATPIGDTARLHADARALLAAG